MATKRKMSSRRADEGSLGGFTIIEVVLVLAIAGLIFLMVFIALPALQRSQRDTQRRDDMAKISEAITQYQTNNQGKLPKDGKWEPVGTASDAVKIPTCSPTIGEGDDETAVGDSCRLIAQYINGVNSAENEFIDPDGWAYGITIIERGEGDNYSESDIMSKVSDNGKLTHMVHIVKGARCSGEATIPSSNSRDYAVVYKLEGSGIYCQDNG